MAVSDTDPLTEARARFLTLAAALAQGEGLPPIAGRIFGLLVFDGGPISFSDLAERLAVSRGSVSTSVRVLEQRGLVRRIAASGSRAVLFDLADDLYAGLLGDVARRARDGARQIEEIARGLPKDTPDRIARLHDLSLFYHALNGAMSAAAQTLKKESEK